MTAKVLIITGDGVNCESETALAFSSVGMKTHIMQINDLMDNPQVIHDYQCMALPGGFSFGDDLGSGKVFSLKIKMILGEEIENFIKSAKPIIGICNGFQVLCSLGIFDQEQFNVALDHNDNGHFLNRWEYVKVNSNHCVWTRGINKMRLPIRHGEGKFIFSKNHSSSIEKQLNEFSQNNLVVMTYENNPNGSYGDIAAITDKTGLVFGLMPHFAHKKALPISATSSS